MTFLKSKVGIKLDQNQNNDIDKVLLERFEEEVWNKVPHLESNQEGAKDCQCHTTS